jgi:hypothetical protein
VNGDARSALSPGFSGQPKIEPGGDEEKKHTKNNVAKLKDESAPAGFAGAANQNRSPPNSSKAEQ